MFSPFRCGEQMIRVFLFKSTSLIVSVCFVSQAIHHDVWIYTNDCIYRYIEGHTFWHRCLLVSLKLQILTTRTCCKPVSLICQIMTMKKKDPQNCLRTQHSNSTHMYMIKCQTQLAKSFIQAPDNHL